MQKTNRIGRILITFIAYLLFVVLVFPYVVMVITSLKNRNEIYSIPPTLFPQHWSFTNFIDIWQKVPLTDYLINTLIVAGGATALTLICAIPAAYIMARMNFAGKKFYMYLIMITQMFSPIVLLVGLFREVQWFGLMDTVWGLVLTNAAFNQAFAVWILSGYFSTIPYELEHAAWIDGCTKWQALVKIILPLALPGIITTVIFVFIAAWNEFAVALTFISTEQMKPLTVGIYAFFGMYDVQWQYVFATSLVAIVPVVILFLSIEKYLIGGLTAGGVKH